MADQLDSFVCVCVCTCTCPFLKSFQFGDSLAELGLVLVLFASLQLQVTCTVAQLLNHQEDRGVTFNVPAKAPGGVHVLACCLLILHSVGKSLEITGS